MKLKRYDFIAFLLALLLAVPAIAADATMKTSDLITKGPWVDVRGFSSLSAAKSYAITNSKPLHITKQVAITTDTDLSAVPEIDVIQGGSFNVSAGATLTLPLNFHAGYTKVFYGDGSVTGLQVYFPNHWGAKGDDSTDCTAAINKAATAAGSAWTVKFPQGIYRVTASGSNYAVTFYGGVQGVYPKGTIIKNVGTGHAVKIIGDSDSSGTFYFSRIENFSVVGNASSGNGISLNPDADTANINRAPAYSQFTNVDSTGHGGHGLVHRYAWATRYTNCKFRDNGGLGVFLHDGQYSEHNNIIFLNCESRWNGGTGDASADFTKGGVRISGTAAGVYWLGGVVESNNAWGFIVGADANYAARKVVIRDVYGEGSPSTSVASATGGFLYLSAKYEDVSVSNCTIYYGAPVDKTGYAFYVADVSDTSPGFREFDNQVKPDAREGTATRDYGLIYAEKWNASFEIIDKVTNRDFSGANNWVNGTFNGYDAAGDLTVVADGADQYAYLPITNINNGQGFVYGKRYGIVYDATASGPVYLASYTKATKLPLIVNGNNQAHEFVWMETNANQNLYIYADDAAVANLDNISIYEIGAGNQPQGHRNGLLSVTTLPFNANSDTALFIVPAGKQCVLTHAMIVAGADAGATTTISIGSEAATYANFIPTNTLSNLDAENDAVILHPVPNTTPTKVKSYAANTVIYAHVANQSGGASNKVYLFGIVY